MDRPRDDYQKMKEELEELRALREARKSMTRKEWLSQPIVLPTIESKTVSLSTKDRYTLYVPNSVKPWEHFAQEATQYKQEGIISDVKDITHLRRALADTTIWSEDDADFVFINYLRSGQYSNWEVRSQRKSSTTFTGEGSSARVGSNEAGAENSTPPGTDSHIASRLAESSRSISPDLVVQMKGRPILPLEMKGVALLRGDGNEGTNLVQSSCDSSGANWRRHCACVDQIVTYMVNLGVGYGVLSSVEFSYFVRLVPSVGVEISKPVSFLSETPTLMEALFFVLDKSTTELADGVKYTFERPMVPDFNADVEDDSPEKKRKRRDKSPRKGDRKSLRERVDYSVFLNTAASNLRSKKKPYSSKGWSGHIGIGVINGQKVAVKIALKYTRKAEALVKEVTAYMTLQRYWGTYVPDLVQYGTLVNGTLVYIATTFIEGSDMSKRAVSQADWRAAEEALNAIHSCGVLHGDIHGGNIMVVEGGGVQFIDFGFSKLTTNEAELRKELNQLEAIFQKFFRITALVVSQA